MGRKQSRGSRKPKRVGFAPISGAIPGKKPVIESRALEEATTETLMLRFNQLDLGGPWCLTEITREDHLLLLGKLRNWETMTVSEIFNQGGQPGKDYGLAELPNDQAKQRIIRLRREDMDRISRLQLTGKKRLYGFRRGREFFALWWDPEHEIWPSVKKHT